MDFRADAAGMLTNKAGKMTVTQSIEELKDNSDDAGATETNIYILSKSCDNARNLYQLAILDNGSGMTGEKLLNACILARHHDHGSRDIGKFGEGMKNATISLGNEILIMTRVPDGDIHIAYLDIEDMKRNHTLKPTRISHNPGEFLHLITADINEQFMTHGYGTLVVVRGITPSFIKPVDDYATEIHRLFNIAYTGEMLNTVHIHTESKPDEKSLTINPFDIFYRGMSDKISYESDTTLRVYHSPQSKPIIIEVLTSQRYLGCKKKTSSSNFIVGTPQTPKLLRLWIDRHKTPTGKLSNRHTYEVVNVLPTGSFSELTVRFISVNPEVYEKEKDEGEFMNIGARRGIYFFRGKRLVASGKTLSEPFDDHSNRQRMRVVFPPELDIDMGVSVQKQMSDNLHCDALQDALRVLWHQQNSEVIRLAKIAKENEKKAKAISDAKTKAISGESSGESSDESSGKATHKQSRVRKSPPRNVLESLHQDDIPQLVTTIAIPDQSIEPPRNVLESLHQDYTSQLITAIPTVDHASITTTNTLTMVDTFEPLRCDDILPQLASASTIASRYHERHTSRFTKNKYITRVYDTPESTIEDTPLPNVINWDALTKTLPQTLPPQKTLSDLKAIIHAFWV